MLISHICSDFDDLLDEINDMALLQSTTRGARKLWETQRLAIKTANAQQQHHYGEMTQVLLQSLSEEQMGAELAVLWVITSRAELISWYERLGYVRTEKTVPFPTDANVGVPVDGMSLEFVRLEKPLV